MSIKNKKKLRENISQTVIEIGGIPIIKIQENDKIYFPLSQIDQKLLLRQKGSTMNKANPDKVKTFEVNFGLITGYYNKQESNCIEEDELRFILEHKTQVVRLKDEQIVGQNKLHDYLGISLLPLIKYELVNYSVNSIDEHDEYTQDIIREVINMNEDIEGRVCSKCNKQYPLHNTFFHKEANGNLYKSCIKCKYGDKYMYKSTDTKINMLLDNKIEYDEIVNYKIKPVETMFKLYLDGKIRWFPKDMRTRENLFIILDMLFQEGKIHENNLNVKILNDNFKISIRLFEDVKLNEIYKRYYGDQFYMEKWKYPLYTFSDIKLTQQMFIEIIDNYLKVHEIAIADPINFNYQSIFKICGLRAEQTFSGLVDFFVQYWKGEYAGYQYKSIGNYYRSERENVLSDLKFLIEKDLKLKEEKIPLYLTKSSLRDNAQPLWNYIVNNKNGSIYDWVNEVYPDRFDLMDFEIGKYRNNFDSSEEEQVDGVLREYFDNVVYNYNNSDQVVALKNKRPDWFIMREDGVWLVEYFGMYIESQMKNDIIRSYIDGVHEKLRLYEELEGYNFLFVYPSDIEKGFLGLRVKIEEIINKGRKISA